MINKPLSFNISLIKNNKNIKDNNDKEKSDIFYDKMINDELNKGEAIKVIKEKNLLNKKIDFDNISTKQSELYINNIDCIEHKNKKLKKLLKCFEDENKKNKQKDNIKNIQNNRNKESIINEKTIKILIHHQIKLSKIKILVIKILIIFLIITIIVVQVKNMQYQ